MPREKKKDPWDQVFPDTSQGAKAAWAQRVVDRDEEEVDEDDPDPTGQNAEFDDRERRERESGW